MVNQTTKRNKLAARSLVVCGTLLAGTAIWMSVINSAKPATQTAVPVSDNSSSVNQSNGVSKQSAIAVQTPISTTPILQQQVIPRFRTRGS